MFLDGIVTVNEKSRRLSADVVKYLDLLQSIIVPSIRRLTEHSKGGIRVHAIEIRQVLICGQIVNVLIIPEPIVAVPWL